MLDFEFSDRWKQILQRASALRDVAARRGFSGNWEDYPDVIIRIGPPASESDIRDVEAEIGEPLPASLRQLFLRGARAFEIMWCWPGKMKITPGGWGEIELTDKPDIEPFFAGGYLQWSLDDIAELHAGWRETVETYEADASAAAQDQDSEAAAHYALHGYFWKRGFPFASASNGDCLAIDRSSSRDEMILLNHEGDSEPGWFLGKDVLGWLEQLSLLGFVGADFVTFTTFGSDQASSAYMPEVAVPRFHDSDVTPTAVIMDAGLEAGRRWQAFFWG
jgi:cell wall assembly regulator SMI1